MSPYNVSKATCVRMKRYLEQLQLEETMEFPSDDPEKLAYRIREAVYASAFHPEFKHFARFRYLYRFEILKDRVRAKVMLPEKATAQPEGLDDSVDDLTPDKVAEIDNFGKKIRDVLSTVTVTNVEELSGILGAVLKYGKENPEIYFPNAVLEEADLDRLWRWASVKGWKIVNNEDAGVTLTKKDVPEEVTWQPK